jgi:hypothetical protein
MAIMYPELSNSELINWRKLGIIQSDGEVKLYKALRNLPEKFAVFFQVGWVLRNQDQKASDGENDFLIFCPDYGYICIEAKGSSGIKFNAKKRKWFSFNRNKREWSLIKDPVKQAEDAKHATLKKIKESQEYLEHSKPYIEHGHAVFFPELPDISEVISPTLPRALIGYAENLKDPRLWLQLVTNYWNKNNKKPPNIVLPILEKTFARSFEVHPLISTSLELNKKERLRLTNDQMMILKVLENRNRVAIRGGAGTGKTVIALEKAKRLANKGLKTLLICYNRPLADHLNLSCKDVKNLQVMSFHWLCNSHCKKFNLANPGRNILEDAKKTYPSPKKEHLFDVQMPAALALTADNPDFQFEAIVCDEGQDFREEFWLPIELLLKDIEKSPFYVFFDENQNIYSIAESFPIDKEDTYPLTGNCRNTTEIHNLAYKFYKGDWVNPPKNPGSEIKHINDSELQSQAKKIANEISNLISVHNVKPEDISVLILDSRESTNIATQLISEPLPSSATWILKGFQEKNSVLIDTVKRFKGLESEIVFLWGIDNINLNPSEDLLYVGISRAKSILYLVGSTISWEIINKI